MPSPESRALDADTIAAVATAPGRGGIGVVRLSGPLARPIGEAIAGRTLPPRRIHYARFRGPDGVVIDTGIAFSFAGPGSFTGEDVVELQGHGGPVVLQMVLDAALGHGARLARPGEFTERAFLNGKLDLAQAEAVADLIGSASAAAARGALRSLEGEFSRAVEAIDAAVLELRIFVEAAIDFPDEAVEFLEQGQVGGRLVAICTRLDQLVADTRQGVLLRDGIEIALLGVPNVGKSSLLNRLAGQERAIVSDIPGTTRDLVQADLVLDGLPIRVVDTAGVRDSTDPIEQEGVRRARLQATRADLVLVLEDDSTAGPWATSPMREGLCQAGGAIEPARILRVLNKVDCSGRRPGRVDASSGDDGAPPTVRVSALTGAGFDELVDLLKEAAGFAGEGTTFTARRRHVEALRNAAIALREAIRQLAAQAPAELVAEELRAAHAVLGSITGTVTADDLLGEIFASFCIGK